MNNATLDASIKAIGARIDLAISMADAVLSVARRSSCTALPSGGIISLGASNTTDIAGNLPDSEVFSRPDTSVYGLDGQNGNAWRMAISMLLTSSPPVARSKAASGFQSHIGANP